MSAIPPENATDHDELTDFYEQQPVVLRCAFCPDWGYHGTVADGRVFALEHRRDRHPETLVKSRSRSERARAAEHAADKRARLHGVERSREPSRLRQGVPYFELKAAR